MTRNASLFRSSGLAALAVIGLAAGASDAVAQPHITYTSTYVADDFTQIAGLAVDTSGNVYISDSGNNHREVVKETPANGAYTATIIATSAVNPAGIAVDSGGNIYIADSTGKVLEENYSNGTYTETTLISSGLTAPYGLAIDAGRNLYITDIGTNLVLKETLSNGTYTQSTIPTSTLNDPLSVAVDGSGNVYIADMINQRVLKETRQGAGYTESTIGSGLGQAQAVAVNTSGIVYIADTQNNRILVETPQNGGYAQSVFTGVIPLVTDAVELAFDASQDLYYAVPSAAVRSVANELAEAAFTSFGAVAVAATPATQVVTFTFDVGGSLAASPAYSVSTQGNATLDFRAASSQAANVCVSGRSYAVGDTCTVTVSYSPTRPGPRYGAVVLYASNGTPSATAYLQGQGTSPQVSFNPGLQLNNIAGLSPRYMAADDIGNILFWDVGTGIFSQSVVLGRTSLTSLFTSAATGLGVDGAGNLLIGLAQTDLINNGVAVPNYLATQIIFNPYYPNSNPSDRSYTLGTSYGSGISNSGLAVDGSGNFFFTDPQNNALFVATFSGGGYDVSSLGSGFSNPSAVAVDGNGAVYIADTNNGQIVKETPSNGTYTQSVVVSGLTAPAALAVDSASNLYVPQPTSVLKETLTNGSYTSSSFAPFTDVDSIAVDPSGNLFAQACGTNTCDIDELDVADAPTLSFATTAVGSTSSDSPRTVTIVNNGNSPLTFSAPGGTAPITAGFTLSPSSTCPVPPGSSQSLTLPVGGSCTLVVSFVPTTGGYVSGTLTVTDNTLNAPGSTQVIKLNGTGTGTSTSPPATAQVTLTPSTFDYGSVAVGSSGSGTFTLSNIGTVNANIASASIPAGPYSVASTTCATSLAAGATCIYVVNFAPTTAGAQSTTFTVTDDGGTQTAALTGTGTSSATPPATTDFTVAANPGSQTVTGGNNATYTVSVGSTSAGAFTQPVALAASGLPAGATVTFSPATVTPGSAGATATMTVHTTSLTAAVPFTAPMALAALFALPLRVRRRRLTGRGRRLLLLTGVVLSLSGCGGGFALPETQVTQSHSYTITITGTSGSLQHSTSVQITLQ